MPPKYWWKWRSLWTVQTGFEWLERAQVEMLQALNECEFYGPHHYNC
jgi:hypothetical protein